MVNSDAIVLGLFVVAMNIAVQNIVISLCASKVVAAIKELKKP